jgi:uncharacterized cupin superfamily protein
MAWMLRNINPRQPVNVAGDGRVVEIMRGDDEIRNELGVIKGVALITVKPGDSAAGHYHEKKREILHLIKGEMKCRFQDRINQERVELMWRAGTRFTVWPGVEHVFVNTGAEDAVILEFSSLAYDPKNPDTIKAELPLP